MLRRSIVAGVSTVRRLCTENVARASAQYTCASVAGNSQVSASAAADGSLLQALQSEIGHELGFDPFEDCQGGSLGDFVLDVDVSQSQDIVIRKRTESENIVVSALLSKQHVQEENYFPRLALMKVCITKFGCSSVLLFNCSVRGVGESTSKLYIHCASYLTSPSRINSLYYRGPSFRELDPSLQTSFKNYLIAKGINPGFTKYVLMHLHKKERNQYISWLQKLEMKARLASDNMLAFGRRAIQLTNFHVQRESRLYVMFYHSDYLNLYFPVVHLNKGT